MFTCYSKPLFKTNQTIRDYIMKSTQDSIQKMVERTNLERNKVKFKNPLVDDDDEKPNFNFNNFLIFIAISSVSFLLYKRLKQ